MGLDGKVVSRPGLPNQGYRVLIKRILRGRAKPEAWTQERISLLRRKLGMNYERFSMTLQRDVRYIQALEATNDEGQPLATPDEHLVGILDKLGEIYGV